MRNFPDRPDFFSTAYILVQIGPDWESELAGFGSCEKKVSAAATNLDPGDTTFARLEGEGR